MMNATYFQMVQKTGIYVESKTSIEKACTDDKANGTKC